MFAERMEEEIRKKKKGKENERQEKKKRKGEFIDYHFYPYELSHVIVTFSPETIVEVLERS